MWEQGVDNFARGALSGPIEVAKEVAGWGAGSRTEVGCGRLCVRNW